MLFFALRKNHVGHDITTWPVLKVDGFVFFFLRNLPLRKCCDESVHFVKGNSNAAIETSRWTREKGNPFFLFFKGRFDQDSAAGKVVFCALSGSKIGGGGESDVKKKEKRKKKALSTVVIFLPRQTVENALGVDGHTLGGGGLGDEHEDAGQVRNESASQRGAGSRKGTRADFTVLTGGGGQGGERRACIINGLIFVIS